MCFHGGSVGHSSSQAATDTFKNDCNALDIVLLQARKVQQTHSDMEVGDSVDTLADDDGVFFDDGEEEMEGDVDEEAQLSESELVDYRYGQESESEEAEDDNDRESGEEDDTTIDELATLGYADY